MTVDEKTTQQKSGMRHKRQRSLVKNNCYTICKKKVAELAAPTKLLFNLSVKRAEQAV